MSPPRIEVYSAHSRASGNPEEYAVPPVESHGSPLSRGRADNRSLTRLAAGAAAAIGLGLWLAGCSDIYLDRRETVALGGGDAVAANEVSEMVDPWPRNSGNKNIAFNGQKMQTAVERYRTGKVTAPADPESFMSTNQTGQTIQTTVNNGAAPTPSTPGQ